ncbi:P-loop containing nucleoside triphosphate hydrolases superfamily protein isoform 1 [Theobroma cacao]|uniref:P-loop containing nucleoside triphosphate hydrolases superfamily protein isoform 1 n=2 Tax=Theobroma cacao TaxID=3641 RepID=A0A061H0F0_THECC|nr:P-loop containing nucleoside triphosphate hydrolases superfamily protein isoform 1 [Theobroma cacao]
MSGEAGLRRKLNKQLKTVIGKPKNYIYREGTKSSVGKGGVIGGKRSSSTGSKSRKRSTNNRYGVVEGSDDGEVDFEEKQTKAVNFDGRRKRVDAEQLMSFENVEATSRKASSKKQQKMVNGDLSRGRKGNVKAIRSIWVSRTLEDATSTRKATSRNAKKVGRSAKEVDEMDSASNDSSKKHAKPKAKANSRRRLDHSSNASALTSAKKTVRDKKSLNNDSEVLDDQPRKKKRVIRLDPYDISNKRLDDGVAIDESTKEKKKDLEENAALSRNAQFRAIQPSPSILSFVEDNLLGRRRPIEIQRAGYNTELSAPLDNIPFSTNPERERIEENIFRNKLQFFAAAKVSSSFPAPDASEIAFAGRSNVGKSSLLNALTRQWGVVRTSDKPGHTQTINFFKLGSKLCLVDLPGYGFAYAKEEVKEAWEELVKEYVSTRVGLKRVCLLIDTKWGMKPRDNELIDLMERSQTKYQIVLTKTDTVFPIDVARRAMQIEESLKAHRSVVQPVMMVSSKSGAGIRSLRTVLSKIARFAKL